MPSTLSILITVFEADERPKAMAAWTSVSMLGLVGSPVLGGVLIDFGKFFRREVWMIQGTQAIVQLLHTADSDESRSHSWIAQRPGERHLG